MIEILAVASHGSDFNLVGLIGSLVFMGAIMYFLIIRPQRTRMRKQHELANAIEVGDEVMTTSGIFATVVEIDDDAETVTLEIAPGTHVRMVRRAIAERLLEEPDEDYSDEEPDEDEDYSEEESGDEEADSQP